LNSFDTGRKYFFSALFVIGILFTAVNKNQHGEVSRLSKPTAATSRQALQSTNYLSGQTRDRYPSILAHRIHSPQVVFQITDPSTTPGAHLVATQAATATPEPNLPSLESFVAQVTNGGAASLVGIYVKDVMALQIVQQPGGDPTYIDRMEGTATQFYKASLFGAIGLLAHNDLSGRYFFNITLGTDLVLVYGNGRTAHYMVSEIGDYQRLSLTDLRSDFVDLTTNQKKNVDEVFAHYYEQKQALTLQTCIAQNGILDWGVRFVLARPLQIRPSRTTVVFRSNP
jgi:hypothetical protein